MTGETSVAVIGKGKIAAPVIEWLEQSASYRLVARIGRHGEVPPNVHLTIDCAGPDALRQHGAAALEHGDLWTVGASALARDRFRLKLEETAKRTGHRLRLFTGWIGSVRLLPKAVSAKLHIEQAAPGLAHEPGVLFDGRLEDAAGRYGDCLNTAFAAALSGPGIENTTLKLSSTPPGGHHYIRSVLRSPCGILTSEADLAPSASGLHPVAAAVIAALEKRHHWMEY